jgi:lipid II:glycine glycyltransferase (peptidoglycan interpeptide bridge formation enzyme)
METQIRADTLDRTDPLDRTARVPPPARRCAPAAAAPAALTVRPIDAAAHRAFLLAAERESVSFLQSPAWGRVKTAWRARSLGWFDGGRLAGTALVLLRDLPRIPVAGRRCLAYIPEGPTVDWFADGRGAADWLGPLVAHLRAAGAFSIKLGPKVIGRSWDAAAVRAGMADPAVASFADLPATAAAPQVSRLVEELHALGWRRRAGSEQGIADVQPRHFLRVPLAGRDEAAVLAGLSPQWRRNVRIAERAGVRVWRAPAAQLPAFHAMYLETARRDRFLPRPIGYFERMFRELLAADPDGVRLYFAGVDGVPAACAAMIRLGRHAWFGYGASTTERRELRASNALQWRMMRDCIADGMDVYDLRGMGETLDPAHPLFGLLRFKAGTGGEIVEYPGEYDLALNRPLALALRIYLRRR